MDALPETTAFDQGVSPLLHLVLPGRTDSVIDFQPDPSLQEQIEDLAEKSTEGELTAEEQAECTGYVRANKFVAILKRQVWRLNAATARSDG